MKKLTTEQLESKWKQVWKDGIFQLKTLKQCIKEGYVVKDENGNYNFSNLQGHNPSFDDNQRMLSFFGKTLNVVKGDSYDDYKPFIVRHGFENNWDGFAWPIEVVLR